MCQSSYRFTRADRLLCASQFQRVFAGGIRSSDGLFTVVAATGGAHDMAPAGNRYRLGLAISRRAAPRATDRNRIKRIIRESFRLAKPQWTNSPIDFVVLARPATARSPNATLFLSLERHWSKLCRDP